MCRAVRDLEPAHDLPRDPRPDRPSDAVDRLIAEHGCEAVTEAMRPLLSDERIERIERVLDARLSGLTAVIENLHDPHNGAAALRSLEAVGLTDLHVIENIDEFKFSPAVTIGCEKWMNVVRYRDFSACENTLRGRGFRLYATYPEADDDLDSIPVDRPVAIVFGNEHAGLTASTMAACDGRVAIPMHGFSQSLNLSVSVALAMHRLAARRRRALGRLGDLDDQKRARLRARWYALGVRGADAILTRYVSEKTRNLCKG